MQLQATIFHEVRKTMKPKLATVRLALVVGITAIPALSFAAGDDDPLLSMLLVDQLEIRSSEGEKTQALEAEAWVGRDLNKIWLKAEAEQTEGHTEEVELQLLYSRAIAAYWDVQVGVRQDFKPEPTRSWGTVALKGLAPYFFDVDAALFIGEGGRTAARLEVEYELLLTQRLILSPEVELNFHGQNDPDVRIGSGLSDASAGLRLRYEIRREFAPYIGVNWNKAFGNTADFLRADGEAVEDTQWLIGIRAWF